MRIGGWGLSLGCAALCCASEMGTLQAKRSTARLSGFRAAPIRREMKVALLHSHSSPAIQRIPTARSTRDLYPPQANEQANSNQHGLPLPAKGVRQGFFRIFWPNIKMSSTMTIVKTAIPIPSSRSVRFPSTPEHFSTKSFATAKAAPFTANRVSSIRFVSAFPCTNAGKGRLYNKAANPDCAA